jgi:predicted ABC-type transport system involved in lysophospholipase L1 biosynthesis ATPase subunit
MERNREIVSRAGQERESEGIIVAKGVKKVYDSGKVRVEALRGVDLAVKEGEMIFRIFARHNTGSGPRSRSILEAI